ncbi:MAG: hypothetical protein HYU97_06330 [Deltaproteobacteria bacterium]|nr:hypothetical protein [Deltaproteobacteria bacterium]
MVGSCQNKITLTSEDQDFLLTLATERYDSLNPSEHPDIDSLPDPILSLRDIEKAQSRWADTYEDRVLLGVPPDVPPLVNCSKEIIYQTAKEFLQSKGLVAKEDARGLHLKPSDYHWALYETGEIFTQPRLVGLTQNFYERGEYERASQVWESYVKAKNNPENSDTHWLNFLRTTALRFKAGKTVIRTYDFYTEHSKQPLFFSSLIGSSLSVNMPHSDGQNYALTKDITHYLGFLADIDFENLSLEMIQGHPDPLVREKLSMVLSSLSQDELPRQIPAPLRTLIDVDAAGVSLEGLAHLRNSFIPETLERARQFVQNTLGFTPAALSERFHVAITQLPGKKHRSHAYTQKALLILDLEGRPEPKQLHRVTVHEWTHLFTNNLCIAGGPSEFFCEGIASWVDTRFAELEVDDPTPPDTTQFYRPQETYNRFHRPQQDTPQEIQAENQDYVLGHHAWLMIEQEFGASTVTAMVQAIEALPAPSPELLNTEIDKIFLAKTGLGMEAWLAKTSHHLQTTPYGLLRHFNFSFWANPQKDFLAGLEVAITETNLFRQSLRMGGGLLEAPSGTFVAAYAGYGSELPPLVPFYYNRRGLRLLQLSSEAGLLFLGAIKLVPEERYLLRPYASVKADLIGYGDREGAAFVRFGLGLQKFFVVGNAAEVGELPFAGITISMEK